MKKLLGIVVLVLLLSSSAYSNGVSGKQLECKNGSFYIVSPVYFVFLPKNKVKKMHVSKQTFEVVQYVYDYKLLPKTIVINARSGTLKWQIIIDRETLKRSDTLASSNAHTQCKLVTFSAKEKLDAISNQLLNEQSKKNKI